MALCKQTARSVTREGHRRIYYRMLVNLSEYEVVIKLLNRCRNIIVHFFKKYKPVTIFYCFFYDPVLEIPMLIRNRSITNVGPQRSYWTARRISYLDHDLAIIFIVFFSVLRIRILRIRLILPDPDP